MEIFIVKDINEYVIIFKQSGLYELTEAQSVTGVYFKILLYLSENPTDTLATYSTDLDILNGLANKDLNLRYGGFDNC